MSIQRSLRADAPSGARIERRRELQTHLGHLDALRGVAVIGVLAHHAGITVPNSMTPYLNVPGVRGLQLFFVLSAFTLLLSVQNRGREKHPTLFFFIRRLFRILPLYYLMTAAMVLIEPSQRAAWRYKWPSLVLLQNLSPRNFGTGPHVGWSLSVEALFYFCFPLLVILITDLRKAAIWIASSVSVTTMLWLFMAWKHPQQWDYWSYFSFPVQFPTFLLGFACFFIWRDYLKPLGGKPESKWLSACLLLLTGIILVGVVPIDPNKVFFNSIYVTTLLLAICLYEWPLIVNPVTRTLGKLSYGIYLIHGLLQALTMNWMKRVVVEHGSHNLFGWWLLYFCGLLGVSSALAVVTLKLVEEPGITAGKRLIAKLRGEALASAGTAPLLSDRDTPSAQF